MSFSFRIQQLHPVETFVPVLMDEPQQLAMRTFYRALYRVLGKGKPMFYCARWSRDAAGQVWIVSSLDGRHDLSQTLEYRSAHFPGAREIDSSYAYPQLHD